MYPGLARRSLLTVAILLGWIGDQPAVVWSRGQQVWDAIIVIIIITLITNSILICVQLSTVDDSGAVVCAVLVAISITAEKRSQFNRQQGYPLAGRRICILLLLFGLWGHGFSSCFHQPTMGYSFDKAPFGPQRQ